MTVIVYIFFYLLSEQFCFYFFTILALFSICLPVLSESLSPFLHVKNQLLLIIFSLFILSRISIYSFHIPLTATSYIPSHPVFTPIEIADLMANLLY